MDRLSPLLDHFALRAGVFYTGSICGIHDFPSDALRGHLHLIRRGAIRLIGQHAAAIEIAEPTLLFLPRPEAHRLLADGRAGADVVCGTVQFGGGGRNPITDSLPDLVMVRLADLPGLDALLGLMFEEAFADRSGHRAVLDRLCEVLIIRLLRHCVDQGLTRGGTLAGLADGRLAKALHAIHADPARDWALAAMAAQAGMSRARFAVRFHAVTGETPANYLAAWRVMAAQRLLQRGRPLKHVAHEVGYGSTSALSRAFVRKLGVTPTAWSKGRREAFSGPEGETASAPNETPGHSARAARA